MFEIIIAIIVLINVSALSLGVGSSTLAITSFLVALKDGTVDPSERRMLGVIYIMLRIAMIGILLTTALLTWLMPDMMGAHVVFVWILLGMLFGNALLMTKHWISMKIGPALQAGTWYTLGFVVGINMFSLFTITPLNFAVLYFIDILVAIGLLNIFLTRMRTGK